MPDPGRVNQVREELKQANVPSATGEERQLREADGEPVGVPEPAIDENSPQVLAQNAETRVWNQWDDETAAKLQQEAGERPLDPEQSEAFVLDETQPVKTTSLGVAQGGVTGSTGVTGATGTSEHERRARQERQDREAAELSKAARAAQSGDGKDAEKKQTAKSGV